jgi:hypothetical protein
MVFHIWNHLITLSLLRLIQLEDMAEYISLSLSVRVCFFCEMNCEFDFGVYFCFFCSTMKSLAEELQR